MISSTSQIFGERSSSLMDRRHSKGIITPIRSKNPSKLFRKSAIWKSIKNLNQSLART